MRLLVDSLPGFAEFSCSFDPVRPGLFATVCPVHPFRTAPPQWLDRDQPFSLQTRALCFLLQECLAGRIGAHPRRRRRYRWSVLPDFGCIRSRAHIAVGSSVVQLGPTPRHIPGHTQARRWFLPTLLKHRFFCRHPWARLPCRARSAHAAHAAHAAQRRQSNASLHQAYACQQSSELTLITINSWELWLACSQSLSIFTTGHWLCWETAARLPGSYLLCLMPHPALLCLKGHFHRNAHTR